MKKSSGGFAVFDCSCYGIDLLVFRSLCSKRFGRACRYADINCRTDCYNRAYANSNYERARY